MCVCVCVIHLRSGSRAGHVIASYYLPGMSSELLVTDLWVRLEPFHTPHTHQDSEVTGHRPASRTYSLIGEQWLQHERRQAHFVFTRPRIRTPDLSVVCVIQAVKISYLRVGCGVNRMGGESNENIYRRFDMVSKGEGMSCGVVKVVKRSTLRWFEHLGGMGESEMT